MVLTTHDQRGAPAPEIRDRQRRPARDTWSGIAAGVADNSLSSHWLERRRQHRLELPLGDPLAAASLLLVVWTDNWLDTYYSSFWHHIRDKLRVAM